MGGGGPSPFFLPTNVFPQFLFFFSEEKKGGGRKDGGQTTFVLLPYAKRNVAIKMGNRVWRGKKYFMTNILS